jgi:hypothetical protein
MENDILTWKLLLDTETKEFYKIDTTLHNDKYYIFTYKEYSSYLHHCHFKYKKYKQCFLYLKIKTGNKKYKTIFKYSFKISIHTTVSSKSYDIIYHKILAEERKNKIKSLLNI